MNNVSNHFLNFQNVFFNAYKKFKISLYFRFTKKKANDMRSIITRCNKCNTLYIVINALLCIDQKKLFSVNACITITIR